MSKNTKATKSDNKTLVKIKEKLSKLHVLEILFGVFIGIIIGYLVFAVALKKSTNTPELTTNITTYNDPNRVIEFGTEERTNVYNVLYAGLKDISNGPSYSQFDLSNGETIAYLYNTKGEVFMQDSTFENVEIILNNGMGYAFNTVTADMTVGEDTDAVLTLSNAIELINKEDVTLYEMLHTDDEYSYIKEYRIDVIGEENIRAIYANRSEEFVNSMMDIIHAQISTMTEAWEPHMIFAFQLDAETNTLLCAASVIVVDGEEYNNFIMVGYDKLPMDWSMPEEFYSYNPDNDPEGIEFMTYFDELSANITDVIYAYAESQGWDFSEDLEDATIYADDTEGETINIEDIESVSGNENTDETVDDEQN